MARPHRPVLAALVATSVVVSIALVVFAWRLVRPESALAVEQRAGQAEAEAGALAAGFRQQLAEIGETLSAWLGRSAGTPPALEHAVVVTWADGRLSVTPAHALAFLPEMPPAKPAPALFDDAEMVEFAGRPREAARLYRQWSDHPDLQIRAGALLRLGRSLRSAQRLPESLDAFRRLSDLGDVTIDVTGLPAGLVGLGQQATLLEQTGDQAGAAATRKEIVAGIQTGRWVVDRANAELFLDEAGGAALGDPWQLAFVVAAAWADGDVQRAQRGRLFRTVGGRTAVAIWRSARSNAVLAVSWVDDILAPLLGGDVEWQLTRGDAVIAGLGDVPEWAPPARLIDDEEDIQVRSWRPATAAAPGSSPLVIWLTGATVGFLWAATYVIARTLRREAVVAQLQTDFVSAVSHEFRSPLTTIRQMAEMLQAGRVTREDRRQEYYDVLAGEATRLQRLVETLLNLGRIEAGNERYELRVLDTADVVDKAIADVARLAAAEHRAIARTAPDEAIVIRADEDAVRLAVRNLLENAIRYSPGQSTVWVRWQRDGDRAAIEVVDRGLGIDAAERDAVFGKFVRGHAATAANAKGTGIGLAMVRHVAEAHGGSVALRSESGETTFTLRLPLASPDSTDEVSA